MGIKKINTCDPDDQNRSVYAEVDKDRREAIEKIAQWTPPLLMTLMLSTRASAASTAEPNPPPPLW